MLKLPEGEEVAFRAGGYVQMEIPPYQLKFSDFDIDKRFHSDLGHFNFFENASTSISESIPKVCFNETLISG